MIDSFFAYLFTARIYFQHYFGDSFLIILIIIGITGIIYLVTTRKHILRLFNGTKVKAIQKKGLSDFEYSSFGRRLGSQITDIILNTFVIPLFISIFLYYYQQRTLGDIVFGTRIYDDRKNSTPASGWQLTGRFLGKFLTMLSLGIGILMILWTKKRQSLHDIIASTVVRNEGKINWGMFFIIFIVGVIIVLGNVGMKIQ